MRDQAPNQEGGALHESKMHFLKERRGPDLSLDLPEAL